MQLGTFLPPFDLVPNISYPSWQGDSATNCLADLNCTLHSLSVPTHVPLSNAILAPYAGFSVSAAKCNASHLLIWPSASDASNW